ncbi:S16 family serine protease [Bifidobacterium panos]|nr:S16 family serine protease [Bifidobacterium sp. DSM 109963]
MSLHLSSLKRWPMRLRRYVRARSLRYMAGLIAVVLSVVVLCLPSAYSVQWPGPTLNVLGDSGGQPVVKVSGANTYQDTGKLLLTTVSANGVPGYPVSNAEVIWALLDSARVVKPREAVVPVGQTTKEYQAETLKDMTSSQDKAVKAATSVLEEQGVDVSKLEVSMHVDDIGGPSAGMMYALGLIDELTPQNESGGKTIAGTGTINDKGEVGAIGGIKLKMLGAKRDGATWFLAPKGNCDDVVGHVPSGLRDVQVSNLNEAYDALVAIGEGRGDELPHCTVD